MNPTPFLLPGAFRVLLEASWQASILVLLVLVVQRSAGSRITAGWRHALWWVVLIRLLLPATPPSPWSLFNWIPSPGTPGTPALGAGAVPPVPSAIPQEPLRPAAPEAGPSVGTALAAFLIVK